MQMSNALEKFLPKGGKPYKLLKNYIKKPTALITYPGLILYPRGVLINTGKSGFANVTRYAPTRPPPRISSL